jgi:hypothetical protein
VTAAILRWRMGIEKFILLVKDRQAIYDACHSEHRHRDYVASVWVKIAQEMGAGKCSLITAIRVAVLLLFLMLKVFMRYFWRRK